MAFVKVLKEIQGLPNYAVGRCYELDDDLVGGLVARDKVERVSFETYNRAVQGDREEALRRSIADQLAPMKEQLDRLLGGRSAGGGAGAGGLPTGGGAVNFSHIAANADSDPALRANRLLLERIKRGKETGQPVGMGEVLNLVGVLGKPHLFSPAHVQHASRRLQDLCGGAEEQVFNETTGKWDTTRTRQTSDGGFETIIRTGADSLAGGTTYGFALKPEYLGNIFEISMEQQVFANAAQRIPVGQGIEVKWPAWDQYQAPQIVNGVMQSAAFSGISLYYETEAAPRVPTDGKLNMIDFKIVDLTAFTALTRDFVVDNYLAFDSALTRMIGRSFGWMEDYMAIQGPGIGRPQGYFNSPASLTVNRANADKIASDDLTAMIASASPMVWQDLRWITNITTIPQLAILLNKAGTPIFQPNALITQAQQFSIQDKSVGGTGAELMHRPMGTLVGFPVYFSEKVPTVGSTGDLSLVAPSQFGVAQRSGVEIAVSEHYYFLNDLIAYRLKMRHDMKSLWRAPYQQADGSNTQVSPFVLLH